MEETLTPLFLCQAVLSLLVSLCQLWVSIQAGEMIAIIISYLSFSH